MEFIQALILSLALVGAANAGFVPEDPPESPLLAASAAKATPAPTPVAAASSAEAASQPAPTKAGAKRLPPVKR
jgi:hypothetical protein